MSAPDDFHELLLADVALLEGHANARQVAAALLRYWERRDRTDTTLALELAKIAGITDDELATLGAQVDRMLAGTGGDARLAVTQRGGLAHELHAAISKQDTKASRQLTELGAGIRVRLRELPKDRYLDFSPVGEGGMGIVYWALDTELGRQVALKVVRPPLEGTSAGVTPPAPVRMRAPAGDSATAEAYDELKARFFQEAWVTGGMEHPGIVPVYELGRTEGGVPYYTMRFIRGRRTLETAIEDLQTSAVEERLTLLEPFLKICDTVAYAHSRGVVHRDLKPANIALGDYGEVIVLDWGLAKVEDASGIKGSRWQAQVADFRSETEMATLASALGTPGYMAPEAAARQVDRVDQLSDVYSLGVILFEILTGRLPFTFSTFGEYSEAVLRSPAPDPRTIEAAIPAGLADLVTQALERDRSQRPAGVAAFAASLRTWQKQRAVDHETQVLLAEAEGALTETEGMSVLAMRTQSERATAACQRVLALRPRDTRAEALLERARHLGETGLRTQARQAQRSLLRRIAVLSLAIIAVAGSAVAWMLEQRRQEAEGAREIARTERDNAERYRNQAEQTMAFITDDLREALEPEGRLDVLARIGEQARAHFASIPLDAEGALSFRRRMRALRQLGRVYVAQGDLPKAKDIFAEALEAGRSFAARARFSARAQFEQDRALVDLAGVDQAQGYPRRGGKRIEAVRERLAGARPAEIEPLEWSEAGVRAMNAVSRSLRGIANHAQALQVSEAAHELAQGMLDDEHAAREHRTLAIVTTLQTAVARFAASRGDAAIALAEDAQSDTQQLRGSHPEDLSLRALAVRAAHVLGYLLRHTGKFEQAERLLEKTLGEARLLVRLRAGNYQWRELQMRVLALLGEARSGPLQEFWQAPDEFAEAYALAETLHAHDPSHAGWIHTLVNLCDRRALAAGEGAGRNKAKRRGFRERAAHFAKALSDLEPGNARWRYLLAFTLGTLAPLAADRAETVRLYAEARVHTRYALARIPTPRDLNDFWFVLLQKQWTYLDTPAAQIALAADTFDYQLGIARATPDAYWPQKALEWITVWGGRSLPRIGPAARAELARQTKATLAWYAELRARGAKLEARISADLDSWVEHVKAAREAKK